MNGRVVVLISGSGSNLQAIIDKLEHGKVVGVISNRADAFGLTRAELAGIPGQVLSHKEYADRDAYDAALIEAIDALQPDLVVLAGFMRILSACFVQHYAGRLMNIHPSLLPRYKGLDTHRRVLEAGDPEHGCSVHFVTEELDGGPLIIQAKTPVDTSDDITRLQERVHALEHIIYPLAVDWFCDGRLLLKEDGVWLDDQLLPACGFQLEC